MNRTIQSHVFTNQLGREWEGLRRRPSALAAARSWRASSLADPLATVLDSLVDLDQIVRATNPADVGETADAALLQLVELAQVDQLAGRIVIQRVLPGLISRAAPYRSLHDDTDPAELIIAAAWIAMRQYDTSRRPDYVAARLISDATFGAFRQPLRRRSATEQTVPVEQFDQRPARRTTVTAFEQLADVIRLARIRGVPSADLQLVRDLVQVGSANVLAAQHGVTPRTIRNRRDRALANIREAVHAA